MYVPPESQCRPRKIVFIFVYTRYNIKSAGGTARDLALHVNLFILNLACKMSRGWETLLVWPRGRICLPDVKIVKGRLKSLALCASPVSPFPTSKLKKILFLGLTGERIEVGICPVRRSTYLP